MLGPLPNMVAPSPKMPARVGGGAGDSECARLRTELARVEGLLAEQRAVADDLRERLAQSEAQRTQCAQMASRMFTENAALRLDHEKALADAAAAKEKEQQEQEQKKEAECKKEEEDNKEKVALEARVQVLGVQLEAATRARDEAGARAEALEAARAAAVQARDEAGARAEALVAQVAALEGECAALRERAAAAEAQAAGRDAEVAQLAARAQEAEEQRAREHERCAKLELVVPALKARLDEQTQRADTLAAQNAEIKAKAERVVQTVKQQQQQQQQQATSAPAPAPAPAPASDDPFDQMLSEQREQLRQFEAENQQLLGGSKGRRPGASGGVDALDAVMYELEHSKPFPGF